MSTPDSQRSGAPTPEFDLEQMFLPAWAKRPANENQFADYAGEPEAGERRRGRRPDRPGHPAALKPSPRPTLREGSRPAEKAQGEPRLSQPQGRPPREERRRREDRPRRAEPPEPLPAINVAFVADDLCVESLARQIRMTGRAYPLFEIAAKVLERPERHTVTLSVRKSPEGAVLQPLFVCALDDTVWLSEDEAMRWVLDKHFTTFYQPERTQIEPPKGTYTFVAQCGLSGVILGPPNYHGYQEALRKLHAERFARMPFEAFKARVKIVRDEAVVKKWLEEQSWRTEYVCLNVPEPLKLSRREDVEKHFRETHLANIIRQVETVHLSGPASRNLRQPALARLVRSAWEQQRRFPIQIATSLSQQFASRGLQFFKVDRTVTHVAVARPKYLDLEATPVSEGVRRIVEYINAHPKCTRRELLGALAPRPAESPTAAPADGASPLPAASSEPTPEETQVIADLHWLIHQGHVIEFARGELETAKKPVPRPPKPAPTASAPTAAETSASPAPSETLPGAPTLSAEPESAPSVLEAAAPTVEPRSVPEPNAAVSPEATVEPTQAAGEASPSAKPLASASMATTPNDPLPPPAPSEDTLEPKA